MRRPMRMDGTVRPVRTRAAPVKRVADADEMMRLMPSEKRREFFTKQYMIELGRLHAAGKCAWPIEQLGEMAERMVAGLANGSAEIGDAAKTTCATFGLKPSYAQLRAFLQPADPKQAPAPEDK